MILCIVLLFVHLLGIDCGSFVEPKSNIMKEANNTINGRNSDIILKWEYTLSGNDNPASATVKCWFLNPTRNEILTKQGDTANIVILNSAISNRMQIINDKNRVISFRLSRVTKTDQHVYGCELLYTTGAGPIQTATSKTIDLQVLDPPQWAKCLSQPTKTIAAEKSLNIDCYVGGNPAPKLLCELMDYKDVRLQAKPANGRADQRNISAETFIIKKGSKNIVCHASSTKTGYINKTMDLRVQSTPFGVRNLIQLSSSTSNSIKLSWDNLRANETGNMQFLGYILEYWMSSRANRQRNKTITNLKLPATSSENNPNYYKTDKDVVIYELHGLNSEEKYTLIVTGANTFRTSGSSGSATEGYGDEVSTPTGFNAFQPGFKGPNAEKSSSGTNTGAIIGGVIGGIVLIAVIIFLVVYCSRNSEKKTNFPTSYVDDAVDYPPNQGQGLYAGVDKKQKTVSRSDSTSGYPDVVTTNGNYPMKPVSSTYEDSTKQYV